MLRPMLFEQTQPLFSRLYRDFFDDMMAPFDNFSTFNTDIIDKGEHYLLQAELPGFKKDEINIDIENDTLKISANHKEEIKEERKNYIRHERKYNSYSRAFNISGILKDKITASYNNGILELKLPKEEAEVIDAKHIEIE